MKALIKDNKVYDVVENEFSVSNEFTWVDCDNTVKQGFSYDGSTFTSNEPTAEETAECLDKPVEDVTKMLRLNEKIASVDMPIGGENDSVLLDILPDEKGNGPEGEVQDNEINKHIVDWLGELNLKQREVLARRFGLLGYEPSTLEDVGREIGLTRE